MTDRSILPVVVGLGTGIAFVILLAVMLHDLSQAVQRPPNAPELPRVEMVVLNGTTEEGMSYSGERGTYCWPGIGCADSGIIIPANSISIAKGSTIRFAFLDSYHSNQPPDELAVAAFDLHSDLEVISITQGRPGGDVEIATFDFASRSVPLLSDLGNRHYALDIPKGEYVIWTLSAWHLEESIGDGDISYFYRISII